MGNAIPKKDFGQGRINTLGQNDTAYMPKSAVMLVGKGSDMSAPNIGQNRTKRKMVTQTIALGLIGIAQEKGNEDLEKSFWNSYYCQSEVVTSSGRLYGDYCKHRFCTICCAIRKAQLINKYKPVVEKWEDPYFVTLTVLSCKAQGLKPKFEKLKRVFKKIILRNKQRHNRGKGIRFVGVRSFECNYNPHLKTYNPHIHLIVANKQIANSLMSQWLKEWGVWEATGRHQDKRPIKDLEHDLIETIKYGTKVFTEPDPNDKTNKKVSRDIYIRAMYNIISVLRDTKQFRGFGFTLPKEVEPEKQPCIVTTDFQRFIHLPEYHDWIDEETGNPLFGYIPPNELIDLLQRIDRVNE
jgi:hypothetical protein